jgi:hypothetical protein
MYLSESGIMAKRKQNTAFWKQMRAMHDAPIRAYAKKYKVSFNQAKLDLEMKAVLDMEDRLFLVEEGLRFDRKLPRTISEEE